MIIGTGITEGAVVGAETGMNGIGTGGETEIIMIGAGATAGVLVTAGLMEEKDMMMRNGVLVLIRVLEGALHAEHGGKKKVLTEERALQLLGVSLHVVVVLILIVDPLLNLTLKIRWANDCWKRLS